MKSLNTARWISTLALTILFALTVAITQAAQAQTYNVIYAFTGGADGASPQGLTIDKAGNLYGTTGFGGYGYGTVYQLSKKGPLWHLNPLHLFTGGSDGDGPNLRAVFGPDGSLYGTTLFGGNGNAGVVFNLRPPVTACKTALCPWKENILYSFTGGDDGAGPGWGAVVFDKAGNIYGTTGGGANGYGTVYQLAKSNGNWTLNSLYSFTGASDGGFPYSGVIFDNAGNLYGAAYEGGILSCGCGTVFQLTPSGSGWTESTLHSFQYASDGGYPFGGLIVDQFDNLYGTTTGGGPHGGGTVFSLMPSNGGLAFGLVYGLSGGGQGPSANLVMDKAGNLYGTTSDDEGLGTVFELSPSNGGWTYKLLHVFDYYNNGAIPIGNIVLDADGNLYGTASEGDTGGCDPTLGCGVVWEITP